MADISKITDTGGNIYNIKDNTSRTRLAGFGNLYHTAKTITGKSSVVFTGAVNQTMGLLVISGPYPQYRGLYLISSNSSQGDLAFTPILEASGVTLTTSGTELTVQNNSNYWVYLSFLQMRGEKTT